MMYPLLSFIYILFKSNFIKKNKCKRVMLRNIKHLFWIYNLSVIKHTLIQTVTQPRPKNERRTILMWIKVDWRSNPVEGGLEVGLWMCTIIRIYDEQLADAWWLRRRDGGGSESIQRPRHHPPSTTDSTLLSSFVPLSSFLSISLLVSLHHSWHSSSPYGTLLSWANKACIS